MANINILQYCTRCKLEEITPQVYVLLMRAADTVAHLRNGSRAEGLREITLP